MTQSSLQMRAPSRSVPALTHLFSLCMHADVCVQQHLGRVCGDDANLYHYEASGKSLSFPGSERTASTASPRLLRMPLTSDCLKQS